MTETAALADVVLPACSYAEKDGTFTNTEGLVQQVRAAINPVGESRPDWEILSALSVLMGYPIEYGDAGEIFKEIRSVIPGYALLGPTPTPPRPVPEVVRRYVTEGYRHDLRRRYRLPEHASVAGVLTLVVGQTLFHSGKYSRRAKGLLRVQDRAFVGLNPSDAEQLHVSNGDRVSLSNDRGRVEATVSLMDRLPAGIAFFPEHFDEDVRRLLTMTIDADTKAPYYRTAQVQVQRLS